QIPTKTQAPNPAVVPRSWLGFGAWDLELVALAAVPGDEPRQLAALRQRLRRPRLPAGPEQLVEPEVVVHDPHRQPHRLVPGPARPANRHAARIRVSRLRFAIPGCGPVSLRAYTAASCRNTTRPTHPGGGTSSARGGTSSPSAAVTTSRNSRSRPPDTLSNF